MNDFQQDNTVSNNNDMTFDAVEQEDASALKWLIDTEYFDEND